MMMAIRTPDNVRFVVVDVETSGGHPHESRITEISLQVSNGTDLISSYTTLINPTVPIPPYVRRLTGITNDMTDSAPLFRQVAKDILKLTQNAIFVAHNVSFDYHVLRSEFRRIGIEWDSEQLCTIKASRKIIAGQPSYSLGKLSESLQIPLVNRHRAEGDARATVDLLHFLMDRDRETVMSLIHQEKDEYAIFDKYHELNLHELPNKAGLLLVFDKRKQSKFVRAVPNIKKHMVKYLKNREKMKNAFEIGSIDFKVTGSQLLARLLEKEKKFELDRQDEMDLPVPKRFRNRSYMIVDKGPTSQEKSVILIEKGELVGYGILSSEDQVSGVDEMRDRLQQARNPKFAMVITDYLERNKVERLEFLKG